MSFSFRDHVVKGTTAAGPLAGKPYRFLSGNSIEVDAGAGADHMPGFGEMPYAIIRKSNKPKIKLGGMAADEVQSFVRRCGGIGGSKFTISIVVKRPGIATRTLICKDCEISGGAGWKGEEAGATSDLEAICMDILYGIGNEKPRSIYAKVNGK